jgi:hypothetical protein
MNHPSPSALEHGGVYERRDPMRAVRVEDGELHVRAVPTPDPGSEQVLVPIRTDTASERRS